MKLIIFVNCEEFLTNNFTLDASGNIFPKKLLIV